MLRKYRIDAGADCTELPAAPGDNVGSQGDHKSCRTRGNRIAPDRRVRSQPELILLYQWR